ncbi:MAG: hypothetical protein MUF42_17740 [Cytophagaceae bacterium]|jgi:hypothetical protein|nr:hypothetical protein [Cytophagaceae bacterium]
MKNKKQSNESKVEPMTIDRLKKLKGFTNIPDQDLEKILDFTRVLAGILKEITLELYQQEYESNPDNILDQK